MPSKVFDENEMIINSPTSIAEVWELITNFIPHFILDVITHPMLESKLDHVSKGAPGSSWKMMTPLSYIVNTMATLDLVPYVARSTVARVLALFSWYLPISVSDGKYFKYSWIYKEGFVLDLLFFTRWKPIANFGEFIIFELEFENCPF